jgi:transglutaminase-like putative cysteine protease
MLIVHHETHLTYSDRISETVMELRMTPREDPYQTVRSHRIDVGPTANVAPYVDWLGNSVHLFSVLPYHDRVVISVQSAVDLSMAPSDLPDIGDIDSSRYPLQVLPWLRFGGLVHHDERLDALAERIGMTGDPSWRGRVEKVTQGLRDHITYQKGVTTSATTIGHALDEGAGVCQDLAHIAIGLFRYAGVPARYVSGYYASQEGPEELETHAWCDVFAPGHGWVGIDPTHRCVRGPGHIVVAIGRDYADVPPNRGVFKGSATESIDVRVSIETAQELPDSLKASRVLPLDVATFGEAARVHEESINYQQEQQQQSGA